MGILRSVPAGVIAQHPPATTAVLQVPMMSMPSTRSWSSWLALFLAFSLGHMLFEVYPFLESVAGNFHTPAEYAFHGLAYLSHSMLYLLPASVLLAIAGRLLPNRTVILSVLAILLTTLSLLFIHIDQAIYDLYDFHFNGFALNLVMTPGGIQSLGAGSSSYVTAALVGLRILSLQVGFLFLAGWLAKRAPVGKAVSLTALLLFAGSTVGERVMYGISDIRNNGAILDTARVYPFYKKTTFRSIARKMGITIERNEGFVAKKDSSRLVYPIQPVNFAPVSRPPNIVWLVAESLRWDRLNPDMMPNTWAFSAKAQRFSRHYSSGNGTREGLFGMFYGLSGSSWSKFLHAERSPLLMDRIQALNYQLDLRTSARFSYPEFNKTLFANVPQQFLHEEEFQETPWQRDRDNTTALIDFIRHRDTSRPFMTFMFFESTHASYDFPPDGMIYRPVLESVDYAKMSRKNMGPYIGQLLNRYSNAAHWIDVQLGRITTELEQEGLLDNTIVIITGDHGEEFMEKGFWGHNSSFVEEQVHTPLVVSMPGKAPAVIDRTTSHMDISVTLMQALGATNPVKDYALGANLFSTEPRDYVLISDWHSIDVVSPAFKYRIPYDAQGVNDYQPTLADDSPLTKEQANSVIGQYHGTIVNAMRDYSHFSR